jgi:2',3'-cyclic-nucleotide 2'-phosphodiesterase (5'-nucleotidase family)/LysM repeat protein
MNKFVSRVLLALLVLFVAVGVMSTHAQSVLHQMELSDGAAYGANSQDFTPPAGIVDAADAVEFTFADGTHFASYAVAVGGGSAWVQADQGNALLTVTPTSITFNLIGVDGTFVRFSDWYPGGAQNAITVVRFLGVAAEEPVVEEPVVEEPVVEEPVVEEEPVTAEEPAVAELPEGAVSITIFHTNDTHGRFISTGAGIVGIDAVAYVYAATQNALLVDAGDTIHGLPFATLNRGLDPINVMNMAGYSLMAPGNHEFNYGYQRLLELAEIAEFEILSANITRNGQLLFAPTAIKEIDGVKIGFFGLSHPHTVILTNPANVTGLDFINVFRAAEAAVAELQEAGVDIIVALAHLGSGMRGEYRVDGLAFELAENVPGIDLIIDGHSHSAHANGLMANGVLIAQAGGNGSHLGRVDITFANGEILDMTAQVMNRAYILEAYDLEQRQVPILGNANANILAGTLGDYLIEILNEQAVELGVVVGAIPVTLEVGDIRAAEMPMGNLIANAMLWTTNATVALQNGGGIRAVLNAGEITQGDIIGVLPFGNYVVTVEMTAAQIWAWLERSLGALSGDAPSGAFLQVAGINFTYNPAAPFGERVLTATVNNQAITRTGTGTFLVATNSFLAGGGDGYPEVPIIEEFMNLDEILIAYLRQANVVIPGMENRIVPVVVETAPPAEPEPPVVTPEPPVVVPEPPVITPEPPVVVPEAPLPLFAQLPAPVAGQPLTYVVQQGETLWTIAYNFYGTMSGTTVQRIADANRAVLNNSTRAAAGMTLVLPAQGLRDPITRTATAGTLYLVQRGDSLSSIARQFYGDASMWRVIFEANRARLRNANSVTTGQWLVIPIV